MKANASLTTQTLEGSRYYWMLINNTVKPLDNPKVRQAIGLAIDRSALVAGRVLRSGHGDPRRRHSRVELGLCRHQILRREGRARQGEGAACRGRVSQWL